MTARSGILALALLTLAGCGGGATTQPDARPIAAASAPGYRVHADHETYGDLDALRAASNVIVIGTIGDATVVPGESPGNDPAGDPLPALPHTEYQVTTQDVLKGNVHAGDALTMTLPGGATPEGTFNVDTTGRLEAGTVTLLFLLSGPDGKFRALAGGGAVAPRQPDGTFALSQDVTGTNALHVTEAQVTGTTTTPPAVVPASPPTTTPVPPKPGISVGVELVGRDKWTTILRRGLRLRSVCSAACESTASLRVQARSAKRLKLTRRARAVVVAEGRASKAGVITLRFTKTAKTRLRKATKLDVSLNLRVTGGDRTVVELARTVRFSSRGASLRP
jgi:hypothetical protein